MLETSTVFFQSRLSSVAMLKVTLVATASAAAHGFAMGGARAGAVGRMAAAEMSAFYDFSANTIEGTTTSMSDYKGKPVLILNVASL